MKTTARQFDLFEGIISPDTPLGNYQCCQGLPPPSPLPPPPENPLDHYKRFGVTADEHVQALEWLSDNDEIFASLEDRLCDLEEIGDTAGAVVIQEQLDRIIADYLESIRRFEPKTPLLDATKATKATEAQVDGASGQDRKGYSDTQDRKSYHASPLKWNQLAQGRKALVSELEKHLREKGWPYVAVDEAKKAIFNASEIASFDFLVYSTTGPNLLVLVVTRRPTPAQVQQMTEWEKVFGKDFLAAFTFQAAGEWRTLSLKDLESPNPLALASARGGLDECLTDPKDERSKP
jgi:hypothetical protein